MSASEDPIYNIGEKRIKGIGEEWTQVDLVSQVGSSMAGLLIAVVDLIDKGNRVVLDSNGKYIEDKKTGAQTAIHRRGRKLEVDMGSKEEIPGD